MLGGLLEQNGVLKRAFLKQHNRLNDYEKKMSQERSQIIDTYEKEIKALQVCAFITTFINFQFFYVISNACSNKNLGCSSLIFQHRNYVLSLHLAQATQHGIISGHCNPDVF
jgi:hypothetical protein